LRLAALCCDGLLSDASNVEAVGRQRKPAVMACRPGWLDRERRRPCRQDGSAGEEDGEQEQALHQAGNVVQRPGAGEDQSDYGQNCGEADNAGE